MIGEELHVLPQDDIQQHTVQEGCPCEPDLGINADVGALIWTHHPHSLLAIPGRRVRVVRTWRRR